MGKYSTIKVTDAVYRRLNRWRLQAQAREKRDLSLGEAIHVLATAENVVPSRAISDRVFARALARFCPEMKGIELAETAEMRHALGSLSA